MAFSKDDIDEVNALQDRNLKDIPVSDLNTLPGIVPRKRSQLKKARINIRPVEYYKDRTGYEERFLTSSIPLPEVTEKALQFGSIARVNNRTDNVLHYTHFSIVINAKRKLPFFTAVNINGDTWKNLPRTGDTWYYDPRIDISLQIGDELYSNEPKNLGPKGWFDRGHLVRRLDPVWGTNSEALLANEDTFHWTNCSPQYWSFNQGSQLWQGLENYILYNTDDENVKATVFTGPVFRDDDEVHRGVLIPGFYWKIVAVESTAGVLFTSAYIADQSQWAQNIPFEILPVGKYQDYQVPIVKIQSMTGLKFSREVLDSDVLKGKSDKKLRGLSDIIHPKR